MLEKLKKNPKKYQTIKKIHFFRFLFCFEKKNHRKKNAILLVFQYQEDAIQPEFSSPARFRFQGGYPQRDGGGQRRRRKSSCLILDSKELCCMTNFKKGDMLWGVIILSTFQLHSSRDIASLHIYLNLKTVQLSPPMFGQFCE